MDITGLKTASKTLADSIPAATEAAKEIEDNAAAQAKDVARDFTDHATYSLSGIIADIANRLNGAGIEDVDLTLTVRLTGTLGKLKITIPDYEVK